MTPADGDETTPSPERDAQIRADLESLVQGVLPTTTTCLAAMFVFFAGTMHLVMPPDDAAITRAIGIAGVVFFTATRLALGRMRLSSDAAHAILMASTIFCVTSAGSHLYLVRELQLTSWFLLIIVGLSQLTFSPRWFLACVALVCTSWTGILLSLGWSVEMNLYAIAMVSFAVISVLTFFMRFRTLYRLEEMRLMADAQGAGLP